MTSEDNSKKSDYKIGYANPPKKNQFKKGQSGNPKGKKKGARTVRGVMRSAINEKITVNIGGKPKTMTKLQAIVQKTIASSLSGNTSSTRIFFQMLQTAGLQNEVEDVFSSDYMENLSHQDQMLLDRYFSEPNIDGEVAASEKEPE